MSPWLREARDCESYARAADIMASQYEAEGGYPERVARYQADASWYRDRAGRLRERHEHWAAHNEDAA